VLPGGSASEEGTVALQDPEDNDPQNLPVLAPQEVPDLPVSEVEQQEHALPTTQGEEITGAPDTEQEDALSVSQVEKEIPAIVETEQEREVQQQEGHADAQNIAPCRCHHCMIGYSIHLIMNLSRTAIPTRNYFLIQPIQNRSSIASFRMAGVSSGPADEDMGMYTMANIVRMILPFRTIIVPALQKQEVQVVMAAIADGVGARTYSRYGALAAVEGANRILDEEAIQNDLATLVELIMKGKESSEETSSGEYGPTACGILIRAMDAACEAVQRRAEQEKLKPAELHSTLTVLLAIPLQPDCLFVASIQVGDGAILSGRPGQGNASWMTGSMYNAHKFRL